MTIRNVIGFTGTAELDALGTVAGCEDAALLGVFEAVARERAENIALKRERDRLKARIAQEDARLSHA